MQRSSDNQPHIAVTLVFFAMLMAQVLQPQHAAAQTPSSTQSADVVAVRPDANAAAADPWVLRSADSKFTLRIGAQTEFRYTASDADKKSERSSFKVNMVRPQIRATVGKPWLTVFIQPELANVPQLLDLELTAQPIPELGIKVGQFLTPFSRTFYTPVPKLLFPDFSIANSAFRADRDTGVMLFGTPFHGVFEYYAGAFNGNRFDQFGNDDNNMLFVGRLAVNPLGAIAYDETPALSGPLPWRFGIGANGYWGRTPAVQASAPAFPLPSNTTPPLSPNAQPSTNKAAAIGGDLHLHFWLATLQAEAYLRELEQDGNEPNIIARGGYVHASTFVYWPRVELAARFSYVDPNKATTRDRTVACEGLLNLYAFGNNLKLNLRYAYYRNPQAPTGKQPASNQLTAQTQWYF